MRRYKIFEWTSVWRKIVWRVVFRAGPCVQAKFWQSPTNVSRNIAQRGITALIHIFFRYNGCATEDLITAASHPGAMLSCTEQGESLVTLKWGCSLQSLHQNATTVYSNQYDYGKKAGRLRTCEGTTDEAVC